MTTYVCRFSGGLDDLKRQEQSSQDAVMLKLSTMKRFSVFEVTDNQTIAKTMDRIMKRGLIKTTGGGYPWTNFEITPEGQAIIDATKATS